MNCDLCQQIKSSKDLTFYVKLGFVCDICIEKGSESDF